MSSNAMDLRALSRERPPDEMASSVPFPRRRWRTRIGLPLGLVTAVAALLAYAARDSVWPALEVEVVPVVVLTGGLTATTATVQASGWLEADPFPVAVSALTDGVIAEVLVLEGEAVEAGQVVARLVPDDARLGLTRAEAELAARGAARRSAQAALEAAQREWDNPVEPVRRVATATGLLAEREAQLARWPAQLAIEQARLVESAAEAERVTGLRERGQAGDIEQISARQQHEAQRAVVAATEALRPVLAAQVEQARADLTAAQEHIRLRIPERRALDEAQAALDLAEADLRRAQSQHDEAALRLARAEIITPVAGVVQTRLVHPGAKVTLSADDPASAQVLRVYDPQRLQVRVDIPLASAASVGVGQAAEISVEVLADQTFPGSVTRVVPEADVQKNTLQVKVALERPAPQLKPEMLARVRFLGPSPTTGPAVAEAIFAPEELVTGGGDGAVTAWLADRTRQQAELRRVVRGAGRRDGWVEVREGLRAGDRLIVGPPAGMRDGARIRVVGETNRSFSAKGGR